jgi:G:T/U-mismatch repair DNA glycosylase
MSADSPADAWAVGNYTQTRTSPTQPLTLHWNGTNWVAVPAPNPGTGGNDLHAVSAESRRDAWAVGEGVFGDRTLILHWDGTRWARVPSPSPGANSNQLSAVSADSPSDAWAVGTYSTGTRNDTLILHWDGTRWAQVPSPSPGLGAFLLGVSADTRRDAWAVGWYGVGAAGPRRTLVLHWDGTRWAQVPSPNIGLKADNALLSVSAHSPRDAWAAGYRDNAAGLSKGLLLRWDGTRWAQVTCPNPATRDITLASVSTRSPADAWAAGYYTPPHPIGVIPYKTLVLHWNGTAWAQTPTPTPETRYGGVLLGVSATSATHAWAAGYHQAGNRFLSLILHWNGTSWTRF